MKARTASDEFRAFDEAMGKLLSASYQDLKERLEQEKRPKPPGQKRPNSFERFPASRRRKKRAS